MAEFLLDCLWILSQGVIGFSVILLMIIGASTLNWLIKTRLMLWQQLLKRDGIWQPKRLKKNDIAGSETKNG